MSATAPSRPARRTPAEPESRRRTSWWDPFALILLGLAGGALSYDALRQMAVAVHIRSHLAYLFPLVVDGFIAYGVRALLVLRDAPWAARAYAWALFGTASTASLWANAVHAIRLNQPGVHTLTLGDNTVAVLSAIAPLALAGATHMYIIVGRHSGGHGSAAGTPVTATGALAEIPAAKPRAEARVAAGTGPAAPEGAPVPAAGERRRRKASGTSGRNPKAGKGRAQGRGVDRRARRHHPPRPLRFRPGHPRDGPRGHRGARGLRRQRPHSRSAQVPPGRGGSQAPPQHRLNKPCGVARPATPHVRRSLPRRAAAVVSPS